jgi:glycosyltransferase involved in cell wall biosynthesis
MPLVSILITAYNAESWIGETLASAVGQTWPRLEVIVVDDGSTDSTLDIARRYEGPNVRVIHQANAGACAARNRALAEARGDFIQYLDADDLMEPDKIERQMHRLEVEPPDTVASGPWVRFYDGDLAAVDKALRAPDWRDYEPATDWLVQSWQGRGTIPTFAWLTPRAVIDRAGPWNEAVLLNDDGEYFTRVLVHARKIAFVEGAWGYYRSGLEGSISRRTGEAVWRSLFEATALCERTLLGHRDTAETRRACAGLWQEFMFYAYPDVPELVRRAEERVGELGGMYRSPGVPPFLKPVRDRLGWKAALRLQRVYRRSGAERMVQRVKRWARGEPVR